MPADPEIQVSVSSFHPVIFDALDGAAIQSAALRTKGAAGPSGVFFSDDCVLLFIVYPMICVPALLLWPGIYVLT